MPSNIKKFFWLNILVLALGIITSILMAPKNAALAAAAGHGMGFIIAVQIFVAAFMFLMIWLIAFRRQNWARWVWVILFILGATPYLLTFKNFMGFTLAGAISLAQLALQVAGLYFVFTGDAVAWFKRDEAA